LPCELTQRKFHRHFDDHVHRRTAAARGVEAPLSNGGHRTLFQASTNPTQQSDVANRAVAAHDNLQDDITSDAAPPRFIRVFCFDLAHQTGRIDSASWPVRSAADTSAAAVADPGP
jgi:hypothetical protein